MLFNLRHRDEIEIYYFQFLDFETRTRIEIKTIFETAIFLSTTNTVNFFHFLWKVWNLNENLIFQHKGKNIFLSILYFTMKKKISFYQSRVSI